MKTLLLLTAVVSIVWITRPSGAEEPRDVSPTQFIGVIEVRDPALKDLVDPDEAVEWLATGFLWSEGPVWIPESLDPAGGYVLFNDIPRNTIYRWKEGAGLSKYLHPSGYTGAESRGGESGANGLALDQEGRLILCQHGDHRLARMTAPVKSPAAEFETIADKYQGQSLNSPNDVAMHSSGALYFTDPPYGREGGFDATDRDLDFQGVYRVAPSGDLQLLTKKLRAPNGIAFSPDEKTLYVAQSDSNNAIYMAYQVGDDGTIDEGRVLLDATPLLQFNQGNPDGMAIDEHGNLFATGPGGVLIITPEGKHLGTIRTGEKIANCAFGDDGRTLYMTSHMHLCRVKVKTKGHGF